MFRFCVDVGHCRARGIENGCYSKDVILPFFYETFLKRKQEQGILPLKLNKSQVVILVAWITATPKTAERDKIIKGAERLNNGTASRKSAYKLEISLIGSEKKRKRKELNAEKLRINKGLWFGTKIVLMFS